MTFVSLDFSCLTSPENINLISFKGKAYLQIIRNCGFYFVGRSVLVIFKSRGQFLDFLLLNSVLTGKSIFLSKIHFTVFLDYEFVGKWTFSIFLNKKLSDEII